MFDTTTQCPFESVTTTGVAFCHFGRLHDLKRIHLSPQDSEMSCHPLARFFSRCQKTDSPQVDFFPSPKSNPIESMTMKMQLHVGNYIIQHSYRFWILFDIFFCQQKTHHDSAISQPPQRCWQTLGCDAPTVERRSGLVATWIGDGGDLGVQNLGGSSRVRRPIYL